MGRHKNYLYQKRLALRLPIDSFRFDFRYVIVFSFIPRSLNTLTYISSVEIMKHQDRSDTEILRAM